MMSAALAEGQILATRDFDLLLDARRSIRLLSDDAKAMGILGALRNVDSTFEASAHHFRATNQDGFMVDVIGPETFRRLRKEGQDDRIANTDLAAAPITGLNWLIDAPKVAGMAIGQDGMPVWMSCVDPRVFALHKAWVSKRPDRETVKTRRDLEQARVALKLAKRRGLNLNDHALSALPKKLRAMEKVLA